MQKNKYYTCTKYGVMQCLSGWKDEYKFCKTPVCIPECLHGKCKSPFTCECEIGWYGKDCNECVCLPNCLYGSCNYPFQCNCFQGWSGMFCHKRKL